jgi:2-oxoglutarate dehydrogenase E1 component
VSAKPTALPPAREIQGVLPSVDTGLSAEIIEWVANATHTWPDTFTIHPKLAKQLEARAKEFASGEVDWALGEALAFGTTLYEGNDVRLVGQDVRRGTFSHRHAAFNDYVTGERHLPLNHLRQGQGEFRLFDSALSEYAALGFEYGYSIENPNALVMWEAQFGDFVNGAQIIIDQYISAAEDKWGVTSGLVMLLPHGFEGQGPEHSSARIERFLTLAAEDNWQVANVTTASQYFHLLRRQLHREVRKPLVVFTPKSGLRAKYAKSPVSEFLPGTHFREVLDDAMVQDASSVRRVVFASGKVAAEAATRRDESGAPVAVVRVEQLYPFPSEQIAAAASRYVNATEVVWLQEEPENMGPWLFVADRLRWCIGDRSLRVCSRLESASPASGSSYVHAFEQEDVLSRAVTWGLI